MFYKISKAVALLVALFAILSVFGCKELAVKTEEFQETYQVEAGTQLKVHNRNGNIEIEKWDNDYVEVRAEKKTWWRRGELDKVEIQVNTNGDMSIKTHYIEKVAGVSVNYEIKVPAQVLVNLVKTSNGKIELKGTSGDATVNTSNGKIIIEDVQGYVTAETSNGKIIIEGTKGIVKAKTSNGKIKAEVLAIPAEGAIFKTSNGSIELQLATDLNADIEAETSNGKITIHDLPVAASESSSKYVRGKMGKGGSKLSIKTSNGKIVLEEL